MITSGENFITNVRLNRRRVTAVAGCVVAVALLTACGGSSSSSNAIGTTSPAGTSTSPTTSSSTTDSASTAPSTPATSAAPGSQASATLAAKMQGGLADVTSAHFDLSSSLSGQSLFTGAGDEKLSGGKLTALDLSEKISTTMIGIRVVGNSVWAKLPASAGGDAAKPWLKADSSSTNTVLRQLASSIATARDNASLDSYRLFAAAASSIKDVGPATVSGTAVEHYKLTVDVQKLTGLGYASLKGLSTTGVKSIPTDLWIDKNGRPYEVVNTVALQGKQVVTKIVIGKYNSPVTITAPPAAQIGD